MTTTRVLPKSFFKRWQHFDAFGVRQIEVHQNQVGGHFPEQVTLLARAGHSVDMIVNFPCEADNTACGSPSTKMGWTSASSTLSDWMNGLGDMIDAPYFNFYTIVVNCNTLSTLLSRYFYFLDDFVQHFAV